MAKDDDDVQLDPTLDFIAGTCAGIGSLVVGYPLDTCKVRLQSSETARKYTGTWNALRTITREETVRGLYKGISSPLAGAAFLNGLVFASYGFLIRVQLNNKYEEPTIAQYTLAGAGTGVAASIITAPMELIKIRQQNTLGNTQLPTTRQVALEIWRKGGVRGLYRGFTSTALRDLGFGTYFGTYEATCKFLQSKPPPQRPITSSLHAANHGSAFGELEFTETKLSWGKLMIAGGLAGVTSWLSTFPLDVIKSRVQSTEWVRPSVDGVVNPYNNTISAFRSTLAELGPKGLFAGLSPTLIRAIPVNMATFLVFEFVVSAGGGRQ